MNVSPQVVQFDVYGEFVRLSGIMRQQLIETLQLVQSTNGDFKEMANKKLPGIGATAVLDGVDWHVSRVINLLKNWTLGAFALVGYMAEVVDYVMIYTAFRIFVEKI